MLLQLAKYLGEKLYNIKSAEYARRSHEVEFVAQYYDETGQLKDVVCSVTMKHYIPRDVYGEAGYTYEKERTRRVRDKNRKWHDITETVQYYELSEADKKFIYVSYVYHHLNQRQISKLSGIPQPYVFRYIKHMKLKPKYEKMTKSERYKDALDYLRESLGLDLNVELNIPDYKSSKENDPDEVETVDIDSEFNELSKTEYTPDEEELLTAVVVEKKSDKIVEEAENPEELLEDADIDFEKPFHVDPYPCRSEWKVRREQLGLKNAEDWRNHNDADGELKPKEYGDGSTVRRRKIAKKKRKEKRRIKNIQKYNLHQNNRYNMTLENPEGDMDKRAFPDQVIPRKDYIGNGGKKKSEFQAEIEKACSRCYNKDKCSHRPYANEHKSCLYLKMIQHKKKES